MEDSTKRNIAILGGALAAEGMLYLLADPEMIGAFGNGKAANFFSGLAKYSAIATGVPTVGVGIKGTIEELLDKYL